MISQLHHTIRNVNNFVPYMLLVTFYYDKVFPTDYTIAVPTLTINILSICFNTSVILKHFLITSEPL